MKLTIRTYRKVIALVACPTCKSDQGSMCVTASGGPSDCHAPRAHEARRYAVQEQVEALRTGQPYSPVPCPIGCGGELTIRELSLGLAIVHTVSGLFECAEM